MSTSGRYFLDPRNYLIYCSNSGDRGIIGDHPFAHELPVETIRGSIENPDYIYGHSSIQNRIIYVAELEPTSPKAEKGYKYINTPVEITGEQTGKVVTSFPARKLAKTINQNDVHYSKGTVGDNGYE